jgi:hypothetical protein
MVIRIAGRIVTGPAAFFLAWVIDVSAFAAGAARHTARQRLRRR